MSAPHFDGDPYLDELMALIGRTPPPSRTEVAYVITRAVGDAVAAFAKAMGLNFRGQIEFVGDDN